MDFVVIEIFCLLWFSSTLGTFGVIEQPYPNHKAVSDGTKNVEIKCVCSGNPDNIKWSFTPVGSTTSKIIKVGSTITDNAFGGSPGADGKSYTLTVKTASSSTAGTYTCDESGPHYAQLIVFHGEALCNHIPRDTGYLSCGSTLQLLCNMSYIANTALVRPAQSWTKNVPPNDDDERPPFYDVPPTMSGKITTATNILYVPWPKEGDMPIYTCEAQFQTVFPATGDIDIPAPLTCQPFTSPSDVPCMRNGGKVLIQAPPEPPTTTETPEPEAPKPTEDPKQARLGSVRSAETSNLAIRVLGVAGVLLLAQMF